MPRPRSAKLDEELRQIISPVEIDTTNTLWAWINGPEPYPARDTAEEEEIWRRYEDFGKLDYDGRVSYLLDNMHKTTRERLSTRLRQSRRYNARYKYSSDVPLRKIELPRELVYAYDRLAKRMGVDRAAAMQETLDRYRKES